MFGAVFGAEAGGGGGEEDGGQADGGEFAGRFSQFDERGVPTHDAEGAPLAKAQLKKV